ncbi:MAG: hypothetical protein ACREBS_05325 [Nitrososphaerales archaeon]
MLEKKLILVVVSVVTLFAFSSPILLVSNATTLTSAQWKQTVLANPVSSVGCYEASYPSTDWQAVQCGTAPSAIMTVGNFCCDKVGQVPSGDNIQTSTGDFGAISGLTSETDNVSGTNYYSIQDNTNHFSTSYGTFGTVTGFMQFIFQNDPGSTKGIVFIQYWLLNYPASHQNTCPNTNAYLSRWTAQNGACVADSGTMNTTSLENIGNLGYLSLAGYAKCSNCGSNDEVLFCSQYNCWTVVEPDSILSLASRWTNSEWNIFGYNDYSQAQFNSGTSLTVDVYLSISGGGSFTPSCISTSYTGETNNLSVGSCSTSSGAYSFTES